jgi:NAD(P)-dependent dehydrogenase (short-subunit alcohol dehydrogenase family)
MFPPALRARPSSAATLRAALRRLDVAVNNAGTEGQPGPITEQSADSYAATFETNVLGMLLSLKHELRVMLAQGHGSIVNLSSVAGKKGSPGASVYVASKHAVEGLTKSAALEAAASGVRVNAVAPGPVETKMLDRFTGSADRKPALSQVCQSNAQGRPKRSRRSSCFSHPTGLPSSRVSPSPSMVANWPNWLPGRLPHAHGISGLGAAIGFRVASSVPIHPHRSSVGVEESMLQRPYAFLRPGRIRRSVSLQPFPSR